MIASASGVYSEPYNFETCPVQCIALQLSVNGQYIDQTSFVASKGTSETINATAVDVQGCIVPKPALTWVSSQPAALGTGSGTAGCTTATCNVTTPQPGAAAITASCTPPTCNTGFPLNPANLSPPYIPQPVYPVTAISGLVTGAANSTGVLATSQDCYSDILCSVGLYNVTTTTNLPGAAAEMPTPPNSLMFDPAGDEAFTGSEFGALAINPGNLGGTSNPFTSLLAPGTPMGLVTGKVLAISHNGHIAIFSDTISTPNQVYVVNSAPSSTTPLNINSATAAAFSPDGLKAFILGDGGNTLYIYSTLQALQTAHSFAHSRQFDCFQLYRVVCPALRRKSCRQPRRLQHLRQFSGDLVSPRLLPGSSLFLKMVPAAKRHPGQHIRWRTYPKSSKPQASTFSSASTTLASTSSPPTPSQDTSFATLCPQKVTLAQTTANTTFSPVHININQGTFHPINFFISPDSTLAYIVTSDFGILVYDFNTNSVSTKSASLTTPPPWPRT